MSVLSEFYETNQMRIEKVRHPDYRDVATHQTGDTKPCSHPGCKNHVTHPCEVCGYQAGGTTTNKTT